ncbi:signal transduction histidine kinase/CheY-like chemotaxis protein/HPt (histidine-containing phosphotransfer) domain-containing protein [Rhodopseudomonas julia]|uniref:histidine kinase n=1 Tax=Rhodopseudomonas julia TaxID=200617 RepID=A0ABU0C161_9BRAD|nr:hybrid sensor histidine kinase/response regulator [Rhodopseudomonas julia]MDQ0324251.1 signal transduction histidine kinase/CheY-like chemotaxis protein/HPt (histidine-containing phosphotransfer) domain-containing protein [Rhodopseudomonas julia]
MVDASATSTVSQRMRTNLPHLVIAVIVFLIAGLIAWYAKLYYAEQNALFQQETQLVQKFIRVEADAIIVRVKDAAAFIAADAVEKVDAKLKIASRKSAYMSDLGYLSTADPTNVRSFLGQPLLQGKPEQIERLAEALLTREGLVFAISPIEYPDLFPSRKSSSLVFAQALQNNRGASEAIIVYSVVDIKSMIRDVSDSLTHGKITYAKFDVSGGSISYAFAPPKKSFLSRFFSSTAKTDTLITGTSQLSTEIQQSPAGLYSLAIMVGGLFLIGAIACSLALVFIRSQRKSQSRLRQALADTKLASEAKSTFLANMSHEIRTPLNGVLGMAELLSRTELTGDQRRYADQIKSSGSVLLAILNDILDISKIESGQLAIDPIRTRLRPLLRDTVSFYAGAAQHKRVELLLDIDPDLPQQVEVDPMRLRQILSNLISNALKFTNAGEVIVSAKAVNFDGKQDVCTLEFSVRDTGIGIAADKMPKLFSRFSQAEESTTRLYGGTGLGLSICKEICELMGGEIRAESRPGKGSVFTFSLTLDVLEGSARASDTGIKAALVSSSASQIRILSRGLEACGIHCQSFVPSSKIGEEIARAFYEGTSFDVLIIDQGRHIDEAIELRRIVMMQPTLKDLHCLVLGAQMAHPKYQTFDMASIKPIDAGLLSRDVQHLLSAEAQTDETASTTGAGTDEAPRFHGYRALLADDNNVNLLFGAEVLSGFGFDVETATDGSKAVAAAHSDDFDVIFMDCQMPVMDGYEATGILRKMMEEGSIRRIPIVAVTANALKGDRERCLQAGMDAFVSKPINMSDLEALLGTLDGLSPVHRTQTAKASPQANLDESQNGKKPMTHSSDNSVPPAAPASNASSGQAAKPSPTAGKPQNEAQVLATSGERPKIPLIDVVAFRQTRASISKFNTLISFYSTDTAEYLRNIREALTMGRIEDTVLPAHTIKSSSRVIGAMGLAHLAEDFEKRARTGGTDQEKQLIALRVHMERIFLLTIERIKTLLENEDKSEAA